MPWQTEWVDTEENVGLYTSIAIDSSDNPHISYADDTNKVLKYATKDSSGIWKTSVVDRNGGVGYFTSIAVHKGIPHISYYDGVNKALKYATRDTTGKWITEIVDGKGKAGWDTSLKVDPSGKVHISYYAQWSKHTALKYATNATPSDDWKIEKVDISKTECVGRYTSLALDENNKAHISYCNYTNGHLKYSTNASDTWENTLVDSNGKDGKVGWYTSIALDTDKTIYISYYDVSKKALKYATKALKDTVWQLNPPIKNNDVGRYSSLVIDNMKNMHAIYYDDKNQNLMYFTKMVGISPDPVVDRGKDVGWFTSLAIDSHNKMHISYCDYTEKNLKYATNK